MQTKPSTPSNAPSSGMMAKVLSAIRGDKYLAGAYPPDWQPSPTARDAAAPGPEED